MALMSCVGSKSYEALLQAIEEAVRDDVPSKLKTILDEQIPSPVLIKALNYKHLLHQAAWLGHTQCVQILLDHGCDPNKFHRKNGCTPLHLAHFCMIDCTNPSQTITALVGAGGDVNNAGSHKCGKVSLDHAIQRQRLDSIEKLVQCGAAVKLQSVLIAIDVANPFIIEVLLKTGGKCGLYLENVLFWGQTLHRVLYSWKSPRESYRQMFRLIVQASVCEPNSLGHSKNKTTVSNTQIMIENEIRLISKYYNDLACYLYVFLIRNGFTPSENIENFMKSQSSELIWTEAYIKNPKPLGDLCMKTLRSYLFVSGNIIYGTEQLKLPSRLRDIIIMTNPY